MRPISRNEEGGTIVEKTSGDTLSIQERKCSKELKDAMEMAMEGHARMLEQYANIEEKHINLLTSQRRIEDGILDVKKAAAKARVKSAESKDTAAAVQAAGELLVRLKEPEESVVVAKYLRLLFLRAFLVTADVPEIYMQEFWATAKLHQHSIHFKMDTRKRVLDPEAFREMLHISPRIPGQSFAGFPFEEEILEFLSLRISQAQILWGLYHRSNIDNAYLIWEDFVYQVEYKNQKKSNEMYYPRFTKVIIDYFMMRKPSIPRQNRVNWHYVRDDVLFSTIKVVSRHQTTQQYGVILPIELTNDDIRNNKAYKEYYACASGEAAPKPKASARKKTSGSASSTIPPTSIATSTPTTTVVATPRLSTAAKGKQPARATTPTEPTDQHGSGRDEGTGSRPGVLDVPSDNSEEELSWNSSDDEDVDEQTKGREESEGDKTDESDDDDDEEETTKIGEQEVAESDEGDDEATESDRESLRIGEEERMHEEEDAEELYRDVDINQGRGLQVSQETKDTHVILTPTQSDAQQESSSTSSFMTNLLNPITDPGLESLFTTGSTTVTPIPSPQSTITPSIISTFTSASQLPTPPTQIPSLDFQSLPTFASVKTQVKAQVTRILPRIEEAVNAQLEAEVLTKSSHSSRTSYAVAADLSKMELKKILIDKMEGNKSIQRSDEQRNLYKALEGPSAGSDWGSKIQREGGEHASASTPSEPSTGSAGRSTTGSQSRQLSASESAFAEEPVQTTCQMEEPSHSMFETGADDQPIIQTTQHPKWFSQPRRPPTPGRDWNKSVPAAQGNAHSWISTLAKQTDASSSFNELLDTPIDFSNFIMNRLSVETLTPELLAGPTYELMRGSCNSLTELEYHLEEVYKATTDQLDWVNPEGQQYPHNLLQPLLLLPDYRGRSIIPFEHFINNDLEYLRGGASSHKYITSVTKTKVADYGHIKWIEDLVPRAMWIQEPISYDKHALWEVSHWGRKRQQFYGIAVNREFALDVYSKENHRCHRTQDCGMAQL
nr:kinesin-like protein KIN-12B [Tanacetum cinerariifolium]